MADSFTVVTSPGASSEEASSVQAVPKPLVPAAASAEVKPEKLSLKTKLAFGMGGTNDIFGHWLYNNVVDPVFNVFLGVAPTQISIVRAITLLVDACSGLFFGWLSDNTRTRWGRRRPFVLVGSILAGIGLPCLFLARSTWSSGEIFLFMLVSTVLYAPLIASFNTPYQSLGQELTPDYNERTSVQSYKGVMQKAAGAAIGWALVFAQLPMFNDPLTGKADVARGIMWAAAIAGAWMILSGVVNFFAIKERYYAKTRSQAKIGFRSMFGNALRCKPYLVLLATGFVYAIPTGLVNSFGFYALNYHVYRGDMVSSARIGAWSGIAYFLCGLAGILAANRLARVIGKHKTLIGALAMGLFAFGSSWWLYTPENPWLSMVCNGLNGFSATGLWVCLPAMTADVIDYDELNTGRRTEGAFSAAFSWTIKVGMMFSMLIIGPLLEATGFDSKLGGNQSPDAVLWIRILFAGIPVTALLVALVLIQFYPLSVERMREIRAQLEQRRGTV
jgi:GPH family glycoside/pentoside/hexuronide:cation symporter